MAPSWKPRVNTRLLALATILVACTAEATPAAAATGWVVRSSLSIPRAQLAVTAGVDGRIYAIGGYDSSGGSRTTSEVYSPISDTWTTIAPLPTNRDTLAAAAGSDGRIYALGGWHNEVPTDRYSTLNQAYDPSTDTWTTMAPMPTGRVALAATTGLDGRIYAIGGYNLTGRLSTVEVYTPSTDSWSTAASLPRLSAFGAATTGADGRIYYLGGQNGDGTNSSEVDVYTPSTNAWTVAAPMPKPGSLGAASNAEGDIYAVALYECAPACGHDLVYRYSPASNSWTSAPTLSTPTTYVSAALGTDDAVYAVGVNTSGIPYTSTTEALADATLPVGSVSINGGATYATSGAVSLAVPATGTGGVTNIGISNTLAASRSGHGYMLTRYAQYNSQTPITWNLTDAATGGTTANGTKTVYVQWQDSQGNWSGIFADAIIYDSTPPSGSVTINGGAGATNTYGVSAAVPANDALSGVSQVRISNSSATSGGLLTKGQTYAYQSPISWDMSNTTTGGTTGQGTHTIYAQ